MLIKRKKPHLSMKLFGGERGIRTPEPVTVNGFQDRRIRPLCQLSATKVEILSSSTKIILTILSYALRMRLIILINYNKYGILKLGSKNFAAMLTNIRCDFIYRKVVRILSKRLFNGFANNFYRDQNIENKGYSQYNKIAHGEYISHWKCNGVDDNEYLYEGAVGYRDRSILDTFAGATYIRHFGDFFFYCSKLISRNNSLYIQCIHFFENE